MIKSSRQADGLVAAKWMFDWPPDPYCLGCVHYRRLYDNCTGNRRGMVCHHILDTGQMRGCDFGNGCVRWTDDESHIIYRDWLDK